jgi:hypothetical protein
MHECIYMCRDDSFHYAWRRAILDQARWCCLRGEKSCDIIIAVCVMRLFVRDGQKTLDSHLLNTHVRNSGI